MLSDSLDVPHQVSLEIKQDENFFTRIMSKETSMANSSFRVYYGGASGAIPFIWESRPGTPKHTFVDTSIPPLTPPPSYYSAPKTKSNSKSKSMHKNLKSDVLTHIFPGFNPKKTHRSPFSSMSSTISSSSSSSSSTWSSFYSSPSAFINSRCQKRSCFSISRSPIPYMFYDDDDNHSPRSPNSSTFSNVKRKAANGFRGCYLMGNMKNAFLST